MKSLSPVRLFATPWSAAHQAPLSMGFSRQEYWSGVPLPSGILLSYKKEGILVSSNEVDETTAYYIQSEVSQKEKHQYGI